MKPIARTTVLLAFALLLVPARPASAQRSLLVSPGTRMRVTPVNRHVIIGEFVDAGKGTSDVANRWQARRTDSV